MSNIARRRKSPGSSSAVEGSESYAATLRRDRHRNRTGGTFARRETRRRGAEGGRHRAGPIRGHVHQHRLHSHQDDDCQRAHRLCGAPGGPFWRDHRRPNRRGHETCKGAQGRDIRRVEGGHREVAHGARPTARSTRRMRNFSRIAKFAPATRSSTADQIFINTGARAAIPPFPASTRSLT